MPPLPFDPRLARQVKADTLEPAQQPTPRALKTSANFFEQWMLKYPGRAEFHARAELLYAGLLEGDPAVSSYVPHPYRLRVGKHRYTPDCYVVTDGAPRRVVELKPDGQMDTVLRGPVTHFFAQYGLQFEVIDNAAVLARQIEAENWLEIVRRLYLARDLDTAAAEYRVLDRLWHGPQPVGEFIEAGDRAYTYPDEIALLRLLHRGQACADLTQAPLDFDTTVSRCA